MNLPPKLKSKYIRRLVELIEIGTDLPLVQKRRATSHNVRTGESRYEHYNDVSWSEFVEWRTSCSSVLDQVVPHNSIHRKSVESFGNLENGIGHQEYGISFLKSIKEDLEHGFLDDLATEIEAEVTADYMGQAEQLLNEGIAGKYAHVPAAVLTGAVLEKTLKTICTQLEPPEPLTKNGFFIKLNTLIDILKKRGVYNELMAKQLRAWAAIRNDAAHGNFEEFTKEQVENMLSGVNIFLANQL